VFFGATDGPMTNDQFWRRRRRSCTSPRFWVPSCRSTIFRTSTPS
jgi:hypothetical protein